MDVNTFNSNGIRSYHKTNHFRIYNSITTNFSYYSTFDLSTNTFYYSKFDSMGFDKYI